MVYSKEVKMKEIRHGCRIGMGLIGLIMFTLGIYFVVWGFLVQSASNVSWLVWSWGAMGLYFIGALFFGIGKILKHRGSYIYNTFKKK